MKQSGTGRNKRLWIAVLWAATVTPLTFGVNFAAFTPEARLAIDEARAHALQRGSSLALLPRPASHALSVAVSPDSPAATMGEGMSADTSTVYLIDRALERARHRRAAPLTAWLMVMAVSVFAGGSLPFLLGVSAFARRNWR